MFNLKTRRHASLLILLGAFIVLALLVGNFRIISYNFGDGDDIEIAGNNYENSIDLFDDSVMHEITISMNNGDYEKMITTYQETSEKDYFYADVTIDGVEIKNVGIRLKGNFTLSQALGTGMEGMNGGGPGDFERPEGMEPPEGFEIPEGMELPEDIELPEDFELPQNREGNPFSRDFGEIEGEPPFLLKFDEFVPGQTYQGYAEVALRISGNSDSALLVEQIAYFLHGEAGQIVPETSYAYVQTADQEPTLYELSEHIDEKYIEKHFPDSDGILYKAGNFTGFEYEGDDPELYADKFEQKTSINDDDMSQLIQFFKFVTESTDEEFENELPNWLDIESFVRLLALDDMLGNQDSFGGMGSNYYLYYDKNTKQFTMLSWDMNMAMGSMMGGGMGRDMDDIMEDITEEDLEKFEEFMGNGDNGDKMGGGMKGNSENLLKERFFANEKFSALYDEEYARLKELVFGGDLALKKIEELAEVFTNYNDTHNVMDQSEYDKGVENIKDFIQQQSE